MFFFDFRAPFGPPRSLKISKNQVKKSQDFSMSQKIMFFHKKIDVQKKHVFWSLLDLQKPPKISPWAWVLIDPFVFCSENVPENHQVLKSEVPGLQKWSPGLQKWSRKHQKLALGSSRKRPIIQLIPSILRLAYYGPAECAKRLNNLMTWFKYVCVGPRPTRLKYIFG